MGNNRAPRPAGEVIDTGSFERSLDDHPWLVTSRGGTLIRADYRGGAYVDLTFGFWGYKPTEVINVWDDDRNSPEIPPSLTGIAIVLEEWMEKQDEENPGWLEQYLENARW